MADEEKGRYRLIRVDRITQDRFPVKADISLGAAMARADRENETSPPERDLHCVEDDHEVIVYPR